MSLRVNLSIVSLASEAIASFQQELREAIGSEAISASCTTARYGRVDDWWATFEWSSGGMVHVHIAFWIVSFPRIDKVLLSSEHNAGSHETVLVWDDDASVVLKDDAAARALTKFYDRVFTTEWNPFIEARIPTNHGKER